MDISLALWHLFPAAVPFQDYLVRDDMDGNGPYIDEAVWKLEAPIPSQAELEAAWEAYQQAEANKPPPPPTDAERITQLEQTQAELLLALVLKGAL